MSPLQLPASQDTYRPRKVTEPTGGSDSVARSLIENLVDTAKDPEYTERVAKSVVASMYLGELIVTLLDDTGLTVVCTAGSDTVRT